MTDLDDVLERLLNDPAFTRSLAQDPATALAGYDLSEQDLTILSAHVSFDRGAISAVEERTTKAGLFGLLSSFADGIGGLSVPTPGGAEGIIDDDKMPGGSFVGIIDDDKAPGGAVGIIDDNKAPGDIMDGAGAAAVQCNGFMDGAGAAAVQCNGFMDGAGAAAVQCNGFMGDPTAMA